MSAAYQLYAVNNYCIRSSARICEAFAITIGLGRNGLYIKLFSKFQVKVLNARKIGPELYSTNIIILLSLFIDIFSIRFYANFIFMVFAFVPVLKTL